jgi:hypothetical protein
MLSMAVPTLHPVPISLRQSTLCFFQLTPKNIRGDHRSNRVWRPLGPWPGSGRPCHFSHGKLRYPHGRPRGDQSITSITGFRWFDSQLSWESVVNRHDHGHPQRSLFAAENNVCRSFMRSTNTPWDSKTYKKNEDMKKIDEVSIYVWTHFFLSILWK